VKVLIESKLLALNTFTLPRGLICLKRVREALVPRGFDGLVSVVDRAQEVVSEGLLLEGAFRGTSKGAIHGRKAVAVDVELVRALGAFDDALGATAKALGPDSPRGESATRLRQALFPNGVGPVCTLRFVEKAGQVTFMLERLESEPALARAVAELGHAWLVERLTELIVRYRAVVQVTKPTFEQVREARLAGQEELSRVTVKLLARRVDDDLAPEEAEALDEALGEILGHQEAIRRHRRRRHHPLGVEDEPDELGFDDEEDDASEAGPVPEDDTADETELGDPATPPIAQPLDPPLADHDGAGTGAA